MFKRTYEIQKETLTFNSNKRIETINIPKYITKIIFSNMFNQPISFLPENIKTNLQGWVAGCDICQDVCPWNQRFAQVTDVKDFQPYSGNIAPKLVELAQITDEEWDRRFIGSALRRIKPKMLRRNARANLDQSRLNNDPKSNNL